MGKFNDSVVEFNEMLMSLLPIIIAVVTVLAVSLLAPDTAFSAEPASVKDWKRVANSKNTISVYINERTISRTGNRVKFVLLSKFQKPQPNGTVDLISNAVVDCNWKAIAYAQHTGYAKGGVFVDQHIFNPDNLLFVQTADPTVKYLVDHLCPLKQQAKPQQAVKTAVALKKPM